MFIKANDCTVVILSFNTKDITKNCLERAVQSAEYCEKKLHNKVHLVVVDNASSDGTVEMIKKKFPSVSLLSQKENVGVAKGYNVGMKYAKTPFILIINSDTYIEKETLVKSLEFMEKNNADAMICRLLNRNMVFRPYGGHLPTPTNTVRWLLGGESVPIFRNFIKRIYCYNDGFYTKQNTMEWVPTCFLFLKKEVYEKTKGHDEHMFFYMDDVEWCKRIKDNGYTISYTPDFQVQHLGGESSAKKWTATRLLQNQVNGLKYYFKIHYPQSFFPILILLRIGFTMRSILYMFLGYKDAANAYRSVRIF